MTITVTALKPYSLYFCSVAALNVDGQGPPATQSYTTSESGEHWKIFGVGTGSGGGGGEHVDIATVSTFAKLHCK